MRSILLGMLAATAACTAPEVPRGNPNEGMLRDFVDGKFDSAGHPLNATVSQAESVCQTSGTTSEGALRLTTACEVSLPGVEQRGDLVASLRIRVRSAQGSGSLITARILSSTRATLASASLTPAQLRSSSWIDLPLSWFSDGEPVTLQITPSAGALIDFDYVEVFPRRFGLVASPGSGVFADADRLVFEMPRYRKLDKVMLDGTDVTSRIDSLVDAGSATRTTTAFRTLFDVGVGDLAMERRTTSELELRAGTWAARMQLHRSLAPCIFEGDATGVKVLITGFQPFPADGWHDNVSAIAVTSLDTTQLRGAQVMRVVMPVEYDRAAAQVTELIERCAPDAVISFGQGGSAIALEQRAYNLQDTGEVPGGVPDNRGIIRAATPIDPSAPATRDTLLPLEEIEAALVDVGEEPQQSDDPGRYICNNTMFANIGAMAARGGVGGFIHLPYETTFDATVRERYGKVVLAAVQATADSLR